MQIELIGCTGAGKSTLAQHVIDASLKDGPKTVTGDDFALSRARLGWVANRPLRILSVDLISLSYCLLSWRAHAEFLGFASRVIRSLPIGLGQKLNLMRNVLKKTGIHELASRRSPGDQIVIVDEGTLHAAHNLFVHVEMEPDLGLLDEFVKLVPLPDAAVHVMQDEAVLFDRISRRGHKRIADHSDTAITNHFVRSAVTTFAELTKRQEVKRRLIVVDPHLCISPPAEAHPSLVVAVEVIQRGLARSKGRGSGTRDTSETTS